MARDYKSRASSSKSKSKPHSPLVPFLVGLMVGIFLTALAWLKLGPAFPGIEKNVILKPQPTVPSEKSLASEPSQRYDFYTILPEMEVLIPDEEISPPESSVSKRPKVVETAAEYRQSSYMLQMGSFRRNSDAERRKAQLALIGIEATIQAVNAGSREALYRVRSGPYSSRQRIADVRARARQNNIDSLAIKLKK